MKIGVFDSGLGGKYVADRLAEIFPQDDIRYVNDVNNLPYGDKTPEQLQQLTEAAIRPLLDANCDAIVIACNSATMNAIHYLRQTYPSFFFIGIEPMLKPAAQYSKTKTIAVCATPATLSSSSYANLKQKYVADYTVIEPDCATWAQIIENKKADTIDVDSLVASLVQQNCDVIVLGCTHYHYLKDRFQAAAPHVTILEPTDAIARRIKDQLIEARSQLR